jgi:hypothetical protein
LERETVQPAREFGAGNGARTRGIKLGKLALYQLSYSRLLNIIKELKKEIKWSFTTGANAYPTVQCLRSRAAGPRVQETIREAMEEGRWKRDIANRGPQSLECRNPDSRLTGFATYSLPCILRSAPFTISD